MLGQSSWASNRRRYDAYSLRGHRNVQYPPQPAFVRTSRRGPVPGPIRNPINPYRTTSQINTIKKTTSCPNNSRTPLRNPLPQVSNLGCKKSLSMVDLSPVSIKPEIPALSSESTASLHTRLRKAIESGGTPRGPCEVSLGDGVKSGGGSGGMSSWSEGLNRVDFAAPPDTNRAASLVCRALVVNAWRRRREDNVELQETIRQLTQQVDHLRIQVVVLRRLLDAENGRVSRFLTEMQRVRVQFEDVVRDRDTLKQEKEKAVQDAKELRDQAEEKSVATENLRNELLTAQTQLQSLDGQISRDRGKLLKLREDKKILIDKIATSEALASEYLARAETAESAADDLRGRLNAQIALLAAAHEQQRKSSQEVTEKNQETLRVRKELEASQDVEKFLRLREKNLESDLSDRDAALRRLESAYNSQLSELNDLRERLTRQSQEGGWSSRVLQIAGSVVRAPRAIFRTLTFLSNPTSSSVTS